jgi:hypothetical protein
MFSRAPAALPKPMDCCHPGSMVNETLNSAAVDDPVAHNRKPNGAYLIEIP